MYVLGALLLLLSGFLLGRRSVPGGGSTGVDVTPGHDGGMPSAVASATGGAASCDAGVQVVIRPGKPAPPVVIYVPVPADAGPVIAVTCPECPTLPTITVNAGASASADGGSGHADAPVVVVTVHDHVRDFRAFGLGPAVTVAYSGGGVGYGAALAWQPADWLELHGVATTKAAEVDAMFRFDLK